MVSRRRFLAALPALAGLPAALAACGPASSGPTGPGAQQAGQAGDPAAKSIPGRLLYVADADLWLWERGTARRLTGDRITRQPVWSPDGKRIAQVKIDVNSSELWVTDADGANAKQLTDNYSETITRNNWAFRPAWWPDGSRLLYLSEETTNDLMIWQVGVDGRGRKPYVTVPDMQDGLDMPGISPDGKRLLAVQYRTEGALSQVFSYALPGGPWRQLTTADEGAYDPVWSHDGSRVAYTVRRNGRHDVWVMNADGSDQAQVTAGGACRAPCWSPDDQQIAFLSIESGTFDVYVAPVPAAVPAAETAAGVQGTGIIRSNAGSPGATPTRLAAPKAPAAKRLTKGLNADAVSGLSWTR